MATWQQKYRVDWDTTNGRNRGAQRTVWEVLMEIERFNVKAKAEDQRAVAFGPGPGEGIRVSPPSSGLGLGDAFSASQRKILLCCAATSKDVRQTDHHGHPAWVKVELLAFAYCVAGCAERSYKNLHRVEVEGFCR